MFYDLEFNAQNELAKDAIKRTLDLDFIVDSEIGAPPEKIQFDDDIIDCCKKHLITISKNEIDFKDRFSFVQLFENETSIIKYPFKMYSDLISMCNQIDFDSIDKDEFKWDI